MPQYIEVPDLGTVEFPDGMSDVDIKAAIERSTRPPKFSPSRPIAETPVGERPLAEPWFTRTAPLRGAVSGAIESVGSALKAGGAITSLLPIVDPDALSPLDPMQRQIAEENIRRSKRTKAEAIQEVQQNPLFKAGQTAEEAAPKIAGLSDEERQNIVTKAGESAGGMAQYVAAGPLAPALIGLESFTEHLTNDFETEKNKGKPEEEAAKTAFEKGLLSGGLQAAIFAALPKPLRKLGDKWLVERYGYDTIKRFLAGRVANVGEGAVLGAASRIGENAVEGENLAKDVASSAAGLGALMAVSPRGMTPSQQKARAQDYFNRRFPQTPSGAEPPVVRQTYVPPEPGPSALTQVIPPGGTMPQRTRIRLDLPANVEVKYDQTQMPEDKVVQAGSLSPVKIEPAQQPPAVEAQGGATQQTGADQTPAELKLPPMEEVAAMEPLQFIKFRDQLGKDVPQAQRQIGASVSPVKLRQFAQQAADEYTRLKNSVEQMKGTAAESAIQSLQGIAGKMQFFNESLQTSGESPVRPESVTPEERVGVPKKGGRRAVMGSGQMELENRLAARLEKVENDWSVATRSGEVNVNADELKTGDSIVVRGEPLTVSAVDEDGTVTMRGERGGRWGERKLQSGEQISVDNYEPSKEAKFETGETPPETTPRVQQVSGSGVPEVVGEAAKQIETGKPNETAPVATEEITLAEIREMKSGYRRQSGGEVFVSNGPGEGHVRMAERLGLTTNDLKRNPDLEKGLKGPWDISGYDYGLVDKQGKFWTIPELDRLLGQKGKPSPVTAQKYRVEGQGPQIYTLIERLPQSETEKALGEQPVKVRNEKTGKEETVLEAQLQAVKERTEEEKASTKRMTKRELDDVIRKFGMEPSEFPNMASKREALKRFRAKAESAASALERLKTTKGDPRRGGLNTLGVFPALWNDAVSVAQALIRAGGSIADAVESALRYIRQRGGNQFDEVTARKELTDTLQSESAKPPTEPPPQTEVESEQQKNREFAQTMAVKNVGTEYTPEVIEPQRQAIRQRFFDGTQEVTTGSDDTFWTLSQEMTRQNGRVERAMEIANSIKSATGQASGELAPALLLVEMQNYALRKAIRGDVAPLRFIVENSNRFATDIGGTTSAAAKTLRALKESSPLFKNLFELNRARNLAAGREMKVGPELFNELVNTLNTVTLTPEELDAAIREGKDAQGQTLEQIFGQLGADVSDQQAILTVISRVPLPKAPFRVSFLPENVQERIGKMFPLAKLREFFEERGSKGIERDWWKLLAGPRDREGPLWEAQSLLKRELSTILKEAFARSGGALAESLPKITDEESLARVLGKEQTRTAIVKKVDENVRAQLAERKTEALQQAGDNEQLQRSIEEQYRQLEDRWDEAMSSMIGRPASDRMLRRMVLAELKENKTDWNGIYERGADVLAIQEKTVDGLMEKVRSQLSDQGASGTTREAELRMIEDAFSRTFQDVADAAKNRYEMDVIGRRARQALTETTRPERTAESIINRTLTAAEDQTGNRNDVLNAFNQYLSGRIVSRESFRATLESIGLSEKSVISLVDTAEAEKAGRSIEQYFRQRDLQKAKEQRLAERLAKEGEITAKRSLDKFEQRGTEWLQPDRPKNKVVEIIQEYLTSDKPIDAMGDSERRELRQQLRDAGVSADVSTRLAFELFQERTKNWGNRRIRQIDQASKSKSLKSLIESILTTPYRAQGDAAWRLKTAEDWFMSNGLSREQAVAAAKLFDTQFSQALVKARETAATRVVGDRAQPRTMADLIKAIRTGLTDPSREWSDELAKRQGFKPLTIGEQSKLADLEQKYSDESLSPPEQVALIEQMHGVLRHAGDHSGAWWKFIGETYAAALLSGPRTATLHIFQPPFSLVVRDMPVSAFFQPRDLPTLIKSLLEAGKNWFPEFRYAWQKDAYAFNSQRMLNWHSELKRQFELGVQDLKAGRVVGSLRLIYAWGQYVHRFLQTANQAGMAVTREWKLAMYGSRAMREAGFSTKQIGELADAVSTMKQWANDDGLAQGKDALTARVRADYVVAEMIHDFFSNAVGDSEATKIARNAEHDAWSVVGRRPEGIGEEDEGWLRQKLGITSFMRWMTEMRREGGVRSVVGIAGFGFVNIPLRTAMFNANFFGYGLLRYGVYKYRAAKGLETPWKQTFANDMQARQRLHEAIVGTSLMFGALGWAWAHSSSDDDSDKKKFGMYVTGHGPKNKTLRDAWDKKGFKPNSLVVVVDGKVRGNIPITRVGGALAWPLGLSAAHDDIAWQNKEAAASGRPIKNPLTASLAHAMGTYSEIVGAQGLFQGISHFMRMAEQGNSIPKMLADAASGTAGAILIPGKQLFSTLAELIFGAPDKSSVESIVKSNFPIPFAPFTNKAVNRFGDQIYDRTWYGASTRLGLPFAIKVNQNKENEALYGTLLEKGAAAPDLRRLTIEDRYGPLTDTQWAKFTATSGTALKKTVKDNLDGIQAMPPDEAKKFLNKAGQEADQLAASTIGLERIKLLSRQTTYAASGASGDPTAGIGLAKMPSVSGIGNVNAPRGTLPAGLRRISIGRATRPISFIGGRRPIGAVSNRRILQSPHRARRTALVHGRLKSVRGRTGRRRMRLAKV